MGQTLSTPEKILKLAKNGDYAALKVTGTWLLVRASSVACWTVPESCLASYKCCGKK